MTQVFFYLHYAARNVWRNRRWSSFAMLSVAAGVATVVALRSLGLAIGDSLTSNVRSSNHGDITVAAGDSSFFAANIGDQDAGDVFNEAQMQTFRNWVDSHSAQMSAYSFASLQVTALNRGSAGLLNFMTALFIDPETYPPTQDIVASDPAGIPLADLFQGGNEVVISENLAQSQNIEVGDEVRMSGTSETFVVRGIVPTQAEAGLRDLFAAFFGFVYIDHANIDLLSLNPQPNRVSILLPGNPTNEEIEAAEEELQDGVRGVGRARGDWTTVPELIEQNERIADVTGRFIVVMGLGAMLLGGVGIINTMLVLVRRRTEEIATLKTFGLKGRQVASLFMVEALLIGLGGSVIGAVAGSLLSRLANAYGETFIQQPLVWRIYPEAMVFGFGLGLVVTAVFGVMPVLTAVKVRPAIILRPNETHIATLGVLQSIGVLIFVVVALGLIAGQIIGPLPDGAPPILGLPLPPHLALGLIGVAATLAILAFLVGLLWVLVWVVGKFPAFGWVDLRLALRNLSTRRLRTATTLLAISIGMFALSSITFYGASVREILQFTLTDTFGGNVMIISPATTGVPVIAEAFQLQLDRKLDQLEGIEYRTRIINYNGEVVEIDDRSLRSGDTAVQRNRIVTEMQQARRDGDFERAQALAEELQALSRTHLTVIAHDTDNPKIIDVDVARGRSLTLDDRGQRVAVVQLSPLMQSQGVEVGSTIVLRMDNSREYTFEVVGLMESTEENFQSGIQLGDVLVPPETLGGARPDVQLNTIQVESESMDEVLLELSAMVGVYPLNVAFLDGVLSRFIEQFSALPILVGLLSLGAAAVIMANTVALATLERRRQIGILKAIGLKSKRVLSIMLLENVMISLLGGVLGIGLSALGVAVMSRFGLGDLVLIPDNAQPVAVALVVAAVAIGGIATFLSANVAVRERVLNVLRYD